MAYETLTGKKPVTQKQVAAAAQELRTLLHDLTLQAETGKAIYEGVRYNEEGDQDPSGMYDEDGDEINFNTTAYNPEWMQDDVKRRIDLWVQKLRAEIGLLVSDKGKLIEVVESRKTVAGKEMVEQVWIRMTTINNLILTLRDAYWYVETNPILLTGKQSVAPERLRHAYELSQCMPTAQDIPTTPAENTLRAICALLRNHQVSGSETLTQAVHGKEVDHDASEEGALEEILNDISPTGTAPVTGAGAPV